MSVYVDDMQRPARASRINGRWSHLFADTHDELEAFARLLGLRAEWIQHPGTYLEHYDLTEPGRRRALAHGAQAISYPRGTAELLERKRNTFTYADPPDLGQCWTDR